jgi:hypothetical protein
MAGKNELIQSGLLELDILSEDEETELMECEQVIEKGLAAFEDVGCALANIRDNRLYKATHKRFERYCKDRWGLSKTHVNRKIDGWQTVRLLEQKMTPIGVKNDDESQIEVIVPKNEPEGPASVNENRPKTILPRNQSQTRPLSGLTPDQKIEAWLLVQDWVHDGAKLTSYLVGKAVKQVQGETVRKEIDKTRQGIDQTHMVSNLFRKQYNVLLTVLSEERAKGWKTTSKKEAVRWLQKMITIIDGE